MSQPLLLGPIFRGGDLSDLQQQLGLALSIKEYLGLSKVSQGLCRLTPTDATLVATELFKERLEFQIVGGQTDQIVARQQVCPTCGPQAMPGMVEGGLCELSLQVGLELLQQFLHLVTDLVARDRTGQRVRSREGGRWIA